MNRAEVQKHIDNLVAEIELFPVDGEPEYFMRLNAHMHRLINELAEHIQIENNYLLQISALEDNLIDCETIGDPDDIEKDLSLLYSNLDEHMREHCGECN